MNFPKIIYISDVPVLYDSGGALFMYRLFEDYPRDKLLIIQTRPFNENLRLPGVRYYTLRRNIVNRLKKNKIYGRIDLIDLLTNMCLPSSLKKEINAFKPESVVSVTHGLGWILADRVSKELRIPLHIILHDDFIASTYNKSSIKSIVEKKLKTVYAHSTSKLCISPYMEQYYKNKFEVDGQVLFPFHGKNDQKVTITNIKGDNEILNFCYAGSLHFNGLLNMLNMFAKALGDFKYTLTIFATIDKSDFYAYEYLNQSNVFLKPFDDRKEVNEFMQKHVDVNLLLSSFEEQHQSMLNFPSKIVDYTLLSLPIFIWAPVSSGVSKWANEFKYDGILTHYSEEFLVEIIKKFTEMKFRKMLVEQMSEASAKYLSFDKNYSTFINSLNARL